jgi:eukaryotic-like serine/threonine-protein kinase
MVTFVDPHAPALGSIVGAWRLLARIDSGSYGVVYRAQRADDPESPPVALKLAKQPGDPRFEREAELLRRVRHLGVPRYEGFGEWVSPGGAHHPYIVMELVEGLILYDWFREQQRSNQDVLRVLVQVADALVAVHAKGVIHRDVKGDNIRVTPEGRAVLLDFGAGWYPGARPLTDTCVPPGTTPYRAPELLRFMWRFRKDDTARWLAQPSDDLYALGVTAYRLVTGTYPPPVSEMGDESGRPRRLLRPSELATVAPELEAIIWPLLAEDAVARGTTAELAQATERAAQQSSPEAARPIIPVLAAAPAEEGAPSRASCSSSSSRPPSRRPSTASRRRSEREDFPAWLSSGIAALVGSMLIGVCTELRHREHAPREAWSAAEEWRPPPMETPDAGVGEKALLSVEQPSHPVSVTYGVGLPMPKTPLPGQKKPPCEPDYELAALGACWVILKKEPPCGAGAHDYDGQCVRASFNAPRLPTSGEP